MQNENDFWVPQATADGRLFCFNTLTGVSALELPLETPPTSPLIGIERVEDGELLFGIPRTIPEGPTSSDWPLPGESTVDPPYVNLSQLTEGPPRPPPSKHQDALVVLQQGSEPGRTASRRFAIYQTKRRSEGSNDMPMLLPQTPPMRESIKAVRARGSTIDIHQRSHQRPSKDTSPNRTTNLTDRPVSEESSQSETSNRPHIKPQREPQFEDSPMQEPSNNNLTPLEHKIAPIDNAPKSQPSQDIPT
jgi:hypothetical protein